MRDTFLRLLAGDEKNILHDIMLDDKEFGYGVKVMLLKNDVFAVPEIRRATNRHDVNIRKWIHRFNEKGVGGIASKIHKRKPVKITEEIERMIIEIVTNNTRNNYGLLPLSKWSLRVLAGYVSEINIVDSIIILKYETSS